MTGRMWDWTIPACRSDAEPGRPEMALLLLLLSTRLLHITSAFSESSYEFTAYRMQQYNLHQETYSCSGAIVVAEARTVDDPALTRRCVVMKLIDFTMQRYQEALRQNAAAVLILMPSNISAVSQDVIEGFRVSEAWALQRGTLMPVHVTLEDESLLSMYDQLKAEFATRGSSKFIQVLSSMLLSNGFQIFVNNSPVKPVTGTAIITLEGVLSGSGEDPPTIIVTSHYDSFGLAPGSPKDVQVFKGQMDVRDSRLSALPSFLLSIPRATQLLDHEAAPDLLVNTLEQQLAQYLRQGHQHTFHPDHRVKPAAFDLLGGCLAGYFGIFYFAVQNFGSLYTQLAP